MTLFVPVEMIMKLIAAFLVVVVIVVVMRLLYELSKNMYDDFGDMWTSVITGFIYGWVALLPISVYVHYMGWVIFV